VVHEHPGHEPAVIGLVLEPVARRQHELVALLTGAVERLRHARQLLLVVERAELVALRVRGAELEEDDVVEHQPVDRDRRAVLVDHVSAHARDVAVDLRALGEADVLLDLIALHRDREAECLGLHLGGRGLRGDEDSDGDDCKGKGPTDALQQALLLRGPPLAVRHTLLHDVYAPA
jgi:hypothetical protein